MSKKTKARNYITAQIRAGRPAYFLDIADFFSGKHAPALAVVAEAVAAGHLTDEEYNRETKTGPVAYSAGPNAADLKPTKF